MQSSTRLFRIGTRGSPLALAQARQVRAALIAAHGWYEDAVTIEIIRTTGDRIQDRPLAEAGGKGLFTKEIEEALLAGTVDIAVHSAKDMATTLPPALTIAVCLPREDARDVLIAHTAASLTELRAGAIVGTASLRRQAQLRRQRPDVVVTSLRGNVETRIAKVEAGAVDATLLAFAGLKRLGLARKATQILSVDKFVPAVGQGAIAIEAREDDDHVRELIAGIGHADTMITLRAERAFLAELDGSCRTPIAGHAVVEGDMLRFRGMILKPDGSEVHETTRTGPAGDASVLGREAGRELRKRGGADFFLDY